MAATGRGGPAGTATGHWCILPTPGTPTQPPVSLSDQSTSTTGTPFAADGPLHFAVLWSDAFTAAGRRLADAARDGVLERGLHDVLGNHVIFHWNRLGLPADTRAILARAARETLLNPPADGWTGK
jgi:hypothetical protein